MIEKGKEWGSAVTLAGDEPTVHTDADLAALLDRHPATRVLLAGGDLYRSLGGHAPPEPYELPIDLLDVDADGRRFVAAAHVVVRRRWWAGEFLVAMNGTHLGGWNLGPKAHPNDGIIDLTFGSLTFSDRIKARRRAPAGAHVPHPRLTTRRVREVEHSFDRETELWIDGHRVGNVATLRLRAVPDVGSVVLIDP